MLRRSTGTPLCNNKDEPDTMSVTREDLEAHLERIIVENKNPAAGLYGPGSKIWEVNKEAMIFLGAGRAALLQTAHPFVAHWVDQHSQTKTNPAGRLQRTFANVFAMVFGELDQAVNSARRVHRIHDMITGKITERVGAFDDGSAYEANDEDALFWVHATLWDTSVLIYELLFRELSELEKETYYQETRRFAYLFAVPDETMPGSWDEFMAYNERMWESDTLAVGKPAAELRKFLLSPATPWQKPAMDWYKIMTAGLLPARIRHLYRFEYGRLETRIFDLSIQAMRLGVRMVPGQVRYFPAYKDAKRRLRGLEGRDRIGAMMDKAVVLGMKRAKAAAEKAGTEAA